MDNSAADPLGMEVQRDIFRESFLASQRVIEQLEKALADKGAELHTLQVGCRDTAARLNAGLQERIRLASRLRSRRRLLWVYGTWASVATVAFLWAVTR